MGIILIILCWWYLQVPFTESRECLKNEGIGRREGNIYFCRDEQECCERNRAFTCCEPHVTKSLRQQIQLWAFVALILLLIFFAYARLISDVQVFEKPTLKESVQSMFSYQRKNSQ